MELTKAKKLVVEAGKELVSSGLIARTWGNVSCRISEEQFVITPSGRNYLTLTPDEIVCVRISDLSYEGNVTPSSEKGVHAAAYQTNPKAGFIIHTHQEMASIASVLGVASIPVPNTLSETLGKSIPCADYGLPGTEALCRRTIAALSKTKNNAVIMKHHGALCLGETYEDAFRTAFQLEEACSLWLAPLLKEASEPISVPPLTSPFPKSRREDGGFILDLADGKEQFVSMRSRTKQSIPINDTEKLPAEAALHSLIYQACPQIRFIRHTADPSVLFALGQGGVEAWLDDFAQIVGPDLTTVEPNAAVCKALKTRSAALVRNFGGLCCGSTESDAAAVKQLLEKNCRAFQTAVLFHAEMSSKSCGQSLCQIPRPLSTTDAALMRQNYLNSYSKRF